MNLWVAVAECFFERQRMVQVLTDRFPGFDQSGENIHEIAECPIAVMAIIQKRFGFMRGPVPARFILLLR